MAPMFSIPFLGQALSSVLVYIWSRRNPETRLSFLGLLVFKAPFLPWVLMLFSFVMHGRVPTDEMCGIIVGHVYYFFTDVFPPMNDGWKPLDPPSWWMRLFETQPADLETEHTHEHIRLAGRDLAAAPEVR